MRTGYDDIRKAIMAMGAHADDIEAHVGGTLAKSHANGYEIIYVMSTNNKSRVYFHPRTRAEKS